MLLRFLGVMMMNDVGFGLLQVGHGELARGARKHVAVLGLLGKVAVVVLDSG